MSVSKPEAEFNNGCLKIISDEKIVYCNNISSFRVNTVNSLNMQVGKKDNNKVLLLEQLDSNNRSNYLTLNHYYTELENRLKELGLMMNQSKSSILQYTKEKNNLNLIRNSIDEKTYIEKINEAEQHIAECNDDYNRSCAENDRLLNALNSTNMLSDFSTYYDVEFQDLYIVVYTSAKGVFCIVGDLNKIYQTLVSVEMFVKKVSLDKRKVTFDVFLYALNPFNRKIGDCRLHIANLFDNGRDILIEKKLLSREKIKHSKYHQIFSLDTRLLADVSKDEESDVPIANTSFYFNLNIDGFNVDFPIRKALKTSQSPRLYFVPVTSTYCEPCALNIRRSENCTFVLTKRYIEPIERTTFFKIMESKAVSGLFYHLGRILNRFPFNRLHRKTALFYEKFASKAEEGTFELFEYCKRSNSTNGYFIIDRNSPDYQRIKNTAGVVPKYSFKYYWLLANANYYISTEAAVHLNLMDSNNRYIRQEFIEHPFVFLQHGVTYLKRQDKRSTFLKDKAGEAAYVVVNSRKEQKVVAQMFKIKTPRAWNTGMLVFDSIKYKHINQDSPDKITVMLTWKPYEEHLENFENSSYYKNVVSVYNMLKKYIPVENINIVGHPKINALLETTDLKDLLWNKPISEVLAETKLLITDYSSVCWNTFYQGGGVIFYQPDLVEYENFVGKLIPKDDEYIGLRVFNENSLEEVLQNGLINSKINLSYFRNDKFEHRYNSINEFHDGQNRERIYQKLLSVGIM